MRPSLGVIALVAAVVAAPCSHAQKAGGESGNKTPAVDSVKLAEAKSLDPEDPIPFMLAHTTQLKLDESQATRLAAIHGELERENGDLRDRVDSIRPPGTPTRIDFATITPAQRDSVLRVRKAIAATRGAMHDNSRQARTQALALLTPEQQDLFTRLEQDMQNTIRDAAFGSRNGDGGVPQMGSQVGRPY
jgi:hypothetical protein